MTPARIVLSGCVALCAACSLTISLDGYVGAGDDAMAPDADASRDAPTDGDAATDGASARLVVTSLALVTAPDEKPLPGYEMLVDGVTVPPTSSNWALRAELTGVPGSVVFAVDGTDVGIENRVPYYMCGDSRDGGAAPCMLASGEHVVRVTPRTEPDGAGTSGTSLTVRIKVP
ncbi:MAG TPA: hypothetical protein VLT33_47615 [Labilithrix sp.]|nr:hypothetical protein [Labilithrix sp.]